MATTGIVNNIMPNTGTLPTTPVKQSNEDIVKSIYRGVSARENPDPEGVAYWTNQLDTKAMTPDTMMTHFQGLDKGDVSRAAADDASRMAAPPPELYTPASAPPSAAATPAAQPEAIDIPYENTTRGILDEMLSAGSPGMRAATAGVDARLAAKGLGGWGGAEGVAQTARAEYATPIAQQDAQIAANQALTGYEASLTNWLGGEEFGRTKERDAIAQQYTLQGKSVDLSNELALMTTAHGLDANTAEVTHKNNLDYFTQTAGISQENQKGILTFSDAINAAAQERKWDDMSKGWVQDSVMAIETNPDITSEDKTTLLNRVMEMADSMSNFDFSGVTIV